MQSTVGYMDRLDNVKNQIQSKTPVEIFETLFDDEVIGFIAEQTNLYASQNNNHVFRVTQEEIKVFLAILLLSGYNRLPRERNYWCLDEDLLVPPVANAMSRNRFQEIKKYLHLADNTKLDKRDKMYKIRPLMNKLNKKLQQFGIFHKDLSIDEAMIKYFGHHSSKQFIRGKPVRFGYKNWMLCSSTGYCYNFDTYCGAVVGKKWWWPLFTHMLNAAVVNAWRLQMSADNKEADLLEFQRQIARHYLRCFQKSCFSRKRPAGSVPVSLISNEGGHFAKKIEKQLRCRVCHQRVRWTCIKCQVTLCLERDCFIQFHT
nr:unnamed protein product [Callosobruchus analis]